MGQVDQKKYDRQLGLSRLAFLLLNLLAILLNLQDQTKSLTSFFPENLTESQEFAQITKTFKAANTMALIFTIMQLIVLYVGTNRCRIKPTIFAIFLHFLGFWFYTNGSRWQVENIWEICGLVSFIPTIAEIAVALYTAKI